MVEVEDTPRILFDTGASGSILLHNMEKLDIDPGSIDEVFITHSHWDHTGGLSDFLKVNKGVKIYLPASYSPGSLFGDSGGEHFDAKEEVMIKGSCQIHTNNLDPRITQITADYCFFKSAIICVICG